MKKPFAWYGGKEALASFLVSQLPRRKEVMNAHA